MEAERSPATRAKSLVTFLDEATGPAISRVARHMALSRSRRNARLHLYRTVATIARAASSTLTRSACLPLMRYASSIRTCPSS
jgi:hypothetical protein